MEPTENIQLTEICEAIFIKLNFPSARHTLWCPFSTRTSAVLCALTVAPSLEAKQTSNSSRAASSTTPNGLVLVHTFFFWCLLPLLLLRFPDRIHAVLASVCVCECLWAHSSSNSAWFRTKWTLNALRLPSHIYIYCVKKEPLVWMFTRNIRSTRTAFSVHWLVSGQKGRNYISAHQLTYANAEANAIRVSHIHDSESYCHNYGVELVIPHNVNAPTTTLSINQNHERQKRNEHFLYGWMESIHMFH